LITLSSIISLPLLSIFLFNPPSSTLFYTLSLHDALPISFTLQVIHFLILPQTRAKNQKREFPWQVPHPVQRLEREFHRQRWSKRSEEHTSELQSRFDLVCRLLLEKKKKKI